RRDSSCTRRTRTATSAGSRGPACAGRSSDSGRAAPDRRTRCRRAARAPAWPSPCAWTSQQSIPRGAPASGPDADAMLAQLLTDLGAPVPATSSLGVAREVPVSLAEADGSGLLGEESPDLVAPRPDQPVDEQEPREPERHERAGEVGGREAVEVVLSVRGEHRGRVRAGRRLAVRRVEADPAVQEQ